MINGDVPKCVYTSRKLEELDTYMFLEKRHVDEFFTVLNTFR